MEIYIGSLLCGILLSYIFREKKRKSHLYEIIKCNRKRKAEVFIFAFVLWIVMGMRAKSVGTDTYNYSNIFSQIIEEGPLSHMMFKRAPGYALYNFIIGFISKSPQWVIICNSAVILGCTAYVIYKQSEDAIGSWFVYVTMNYYFYGMNAARQSMAIAMTMLAFCLIREKKTKKAIIWSLLAILIHSSAIVSLVLYPMILIKNKKRIYFAFLFFLVVFISMFDRIMLLFVRFFPEYNAYTNSMFIESLGDSAGGRAVTAIYLIIVIILSFYLLVKNFIKEKEKYYQLIYLVTVAIVPMILMRNSNISYRVEMYFVEYSILLIPFVFRAIQGRINRLVVSFIGYSILLIPYFLKMPAFLPYGFFFE